MTMCERLQAARVHRDLVVDQRAEHVEHRRLAHRRRRVEVGRLLRAGAGEVDRRLAPRLVDRDRDGDLRAAVHLVLEARRPSARRARAAPPPRRCPARAACRRARPAAPKCATIFASSSRALRARRDLRAQVGEVLVDVARRVAARRRGSRASRPRGSGRRDQLHVVEQHALLVDVRRVRRHRARRDAADVGVMAARRDVELGSSAARRPGTPARSP